jgi:glycine/D-amino acid oxidase-like deaminating enzyme
MNHDQNSFDRPFDVVVIGGGIAGLAAANAASRAGARTALLDGHGPGGRAKSADRGGLLLNEGPHALYNAGHAMRILLSVTRTVGRLGQVTWRFGRVRWW